MNLYKQPMQPYPGLETFANVIHLVKNKLTLFYYDTGGANVYSIMLIHGLGDEADTWRHLISPLAAQNRVIAPDLPGFGRSEKPNRAYTLPFFQEVILELMDNLGLHRVAMIGHSLGAIIAHSLALQCPERIDRLGLIDGSLMVQKQKFDLMTMLFLIPGLGEMLYNRLRKNPQAAYQSLEPYYAHLIGLPEAERKFLFQRVNERVWSDGQRRAFLSTLRNLAKWITRQQRDLPMKLKRAEIPTLLIWGEEDQINPVDNGRALIEFQPDTQLIVVANAGHNVQQEKPQVVQEAIQNVMV